ncbi:hypothetical protein BH11CYA1_BH11CYA1_48840 [soil metagenome]
MERFQGAESAAAPELLNVSDGPGDGKPHGKHKAAKKVIDPVYGEDAAERFVADNFDKTNPFGFKGVKKEEASAHKDLAIFVNLAANRGLLNSSLREDEEIRKLETLTKDKSVTVIVQTAMNRDRSLNHLRATKADLIIGAFGLDPDVKHTEVVRYEIANGSKRLLFAGHSRGLTEDLGDLLKSSPQAMAADKVVLLNRAHGMAMHGLRGDAGNTSIGDLKSTLNKALMDAGKKTFDFIDFDSCLIGNAQTLTELAPTAKYIIASEEPEVAIAATEQMDNADKGVKPGSNAQPIAEIVRNMIAQPELDTKSLASMAFSMNEKDCKTVSKDGLCGANTLGLYDTSAAPEFSQALDQFGKVMLDRSSLASNHDAFQIAAQKTPVIDGEFDGVKHTVNRRDLGTYVKFVKVGLADGSIADTASGDLAQAVDRLQASMSHLVAENFNSYTPKLKERFEAVHLPPAALDGVSVFLQERQPESMKEAFVTHLADDSIASQPHWNQFVSAMGMPK